MKISTVLIAAVLSAALQSCFTGIESTPRITDSEVRSAGAVPTPEEVFGQQIVAEPPAGWLPGKQWMVDDARISLAFTPASHGADSLPGQIIRLVAVDSVTSLTGKYEVEIELADDAGHRYYYRPGISPADLRGRRSLDIPFTVELSAVALADSLMRGRRYYIETPDWYDAGGHQYKGLRHVAADIRRVEPGTSRFPIRVAFSTDGDAAEYFVLLTYGDSRAATRNFNRVFRFDDPRADYPRIKPEIWDKIIHSSVAPGMTRDECRLALGAPLTISHAANQAAQYERWIYGEGIYLIFEDGILTQYRQ